MGNLGAVEWLGASVTGHSEIGGWYAVRLGDFIVVRIVGASNSCSLFRLRMLDKDPSHHLRFGNSSPAHRLGFRSKGFIPHRKAALANCNLPADMNRPGF